jgi:predicted ATP-dependent protease
MPGLGALQAGEDFFGNYRVNDLVDNTACVGAPVVFEHSPTYYNLFGRIEYKAQVGTFSTDPLL